ncbi:MAG: helix-turn-helix transcriptional regulator, partial [Halobacteriota archaeon]
TPTKSPVISDDDRVINLLRQNEGQLRQGTIVSETQWSKSKVSRLLSRMDEEGQIVKISVGRENVIALPGEEPDGAKSPYDRT